MTDLIDILAGIGLFQPLARHELESVVALGRRLAVPADTVIFRQGDLGESLYVLLSGGVTVLRHDDRGHESRVARFGPGNYFGEMALIDGDRRSASVVTDCPSDLFLMPRDQFLGFIAKSPPLLSNLLSELSGRIRETTQRLVREEHDSQLRAAALETARQHAITQMVTGIAHELNSPIGVCTTCISLIEDRLTEADLGDPAAGLDPRHLREPVTLLASGLRRVVALVQMFCDLAASHHAEDVQPINLAEAIGDSVAMFRARPAKTSLTFKVPNPASGPIWNGYRLLLARVLHHLFQNVEAHGYAEGVEGLIEITVSEARLDDGDPAFTVTVRDFGAGISADVAGRAFDAFFTTARGRGHKGLGLTVVFNTVTGPFRGRIGISGAPGLGTAVTMTIPARLDAGTD